MSRTSNIVFFGTPSFASCVLKTLLTSQRTISLVVTQPDKKAGRGQHTYEQAVKKLASECLVPIVQPTNLCDPVFLQQLQATHANIFVVAAYGRILPEKLLSLATVINVHASLLPWGRGAAPIARAILTGQKKTGVSIIKIIKELDAGDILLQHETVIDPNETTGELTERLSVLGAQTCVQVLNQIDAGTEHYLAQDASQVVYTPPIKVQEAQIHWDQKADQIHRHVLAFNPWPGAFTFDNQQRIKIFRTNIDGTKVIGEAPGSLRINKQRLFVATKDYWIEILELQKQGKMRQPTDTFLSGYHASDREFWK